MDEGRLGEGSDKRELVEEEEEEVDCIKQIITKKKNECNNHYEWRESGKKAGMSDWLG